MPADGRVAVSERRSIISRSLYSAHTLARDTASVKTLVALAAFAVLVPGGRPLVPPFVQTLVKHRAGDLAYVPTRAPSGYTYLSNAWDPRAPRVTVRVANRRF